MLPMLVLALGAAMVAGNAMAMWRPPERRKQGDLERPPPTRTYVMIAVGAVASVWALATLLS